MKIASRNTAPKQTLARGSAKMLRKFAITAARLNGGGAGKVLLRNAQKARSDTASENVPRMPKTARQPNRSPMIAGDRRAEDVGGERDAEQARDRDLALIDRHEIAEQRHRHRKHAAGDKPRHDPHRHQSEKLVANAHTSAASASTSTQTFISLVLPKKSLVTPSTGWISA